MKIRESLILNLIMMAFFAAMFGISRNYPAEARFFPVIIGIAGMALSLGQLAIELTFRPEKVVSEEEAQKPAVKEGKKKVTLRGEATIVLWVFIGLGLILVFGLWVAIPAFSIAFMRIYGHESWKLSTAVAGGTWIAFYLIFHVAMKIPLYGGMLGLSFI